ncbi:hypothetical protein ACQCVP_07000 [Rossellomorea vietnamensis]|uniref:hypothetical protein n=1 Tax=Rossellomorea vietnamensis TaxID=218284 RepID=UPI003CEB2B20
MKSNGFPLQARDPEGLGAATRRPLVPQEVARLPLQYPYIKGEEEKVLNSNSLKEKRFFVKVFSFRVLLPDITDPKSSLIQ